MFQIQIRHVLPLPILPPRLPADPPDRDGHRHGAEVQRGAALQTVFEVLEFFLLFFRGTKKFSRFNNKQMISLARDLSPYYASQLAFYKEATCKFISILPNFKFSGEPKHHSWGARCAAGCEHWGDVVDAG